MTASIANSDAPRSRIDRVALAASIAAALAALLLPFVVLSPNRIASGVALSLSRAAAAWQWPVLGLISLSAVCALLPERLRARLSAPVAAALLGAVLFGVGHAAATLTPDPTLPARVSLGSGAWVLLAMSVALWFQGWLPASAGARVTSLILGVVLVVLAFTVGGMRDTSLAREYQAQTATFWALVGGHLALTLSAVAIAAVLGVPAGVLAARSRWVRSTVIPVVGLIQTVPSLALLGLLIAPLAALSLPAIGTLPALIALTLYSLLPIVRNTYLGFDAVDPAALDAGRGMGMSRMQLMLRVELPLAMPLVIEGLRQAVVLIVGIAAVMAIGGARTLGILVFLGWGVQAADLTLLGAVPMVVIAIVADRGMRSLERVAVSPGIRASV